MTAEDLSKDSVWLDKSKYDEAERVYYEKLSGKLPTTSCGPFVVSKTSAPPQPCSQSTESKSCKLDPNPAPNKSNSSKEKKGKKKDSVKKDSNKQNKLNSKKRKGTAPSSKQNYLSKVSSISSQSQSKSLVEEIVKAREHIKNSLENVNGIQDLPSSNISGDFNQVVNKLQNDYKSLKTDVDKVTSLLQRIEIRVKNLENMLTSKPSAEKTSSAKTPAKKDDDDDDDVDLFGSGSEDEDEEAKRVKEQRLAEYAAKKSKKPALIAKSMIIFDVKPWDDETDMKLMEAEVRKISMDGLLWGTAKLVPLAYGIHKLQIASVVEDEKVSVDDITDKIQEIEDYVQSVDIAAFNKI